MGKRVAVVSGGVGGLGTAICRKLAQDGCRVIAADLANNEARIAAFRSATSDLDITFAPLDVGDFDACNALVTNIEAEHGSLDILVNAAGITRDGTLRKMDNAQWDAVLGVNLGGVFNLCRHAV